MGSGFRPHVSPPKFSNHFLTELQAATLKGQLLRHAGTFLHHPQIVGRSGDQVGSPHLTWWHWAGFEWTGGSGSSDGADYRCKLLCQPHPHLKKTEFWAETTNGVMAELILENQSLTVDHEGEVAVIKGGVRNWDAPLVVAVVDPLATSGSHVQDSLCGILRSAADQVPVHHSLTVLQPVPGPHHTGAVAGQNSCRTGRQRDVLGLHHHAETVAAALSQR